MHSVCINTDSYAGFIPHRHRKHPRPPTNKHTFKPYLESAHTRERTQDTQGRPSRRENQLCCYSQMVQQKGVMRANVTPGRQLADSHKKNILHGNCLMNFFLSSDLSILYLPSFWSILGNFTFSFLLLFLTLYSIFFVLGKIAVGDKWWDGRGFQNHGWWRQATALRMCNAEVIRLPKKRWKWCLINYKEGKNSMMRKCIYRCFGA